MEDKGATRVLYALKSTGPQSADALARRLKVTVVAARVTRRVWALTPAPGAGGAAASGGESGA